MLLTITETTDKLAKLGRARIAMYEAANKEPRDSSLIISTTLDYLNARETLVQHVKQDPDALGQLRYILNTPNIIEIFLEAYEFNYYPPKASESITEALSSLKSV